MVRRQPRGRGGEGGRRTAAEEGVEDIVVRVAAKGVAAMEAEAEEAER